jgi:hypothetical protein
MNVLDNGAALLRPELDAVARAMQAYHPGAREHVADVAFTAAPDICSDPAT